MELDPESKRARSVALLQHVRVNELVAQRLLHAGFGSSEDAICRWLAGMYYSGASSEQMFALQFVPALVWSVLAPALNVTHRSGVTTCLLAIYKHEMERVPTPKTMDPSLVRMPDLAQRSSIYHHVDASMARQRKGVSAAGLTEDALRTHNNPSDDEDETSIMGRMKRQADVKLPDVRVVHNLLHVCSTALKAYAVVMSSMPRHSQQQFCAVAARLSAVHRKAFEQLAQTTSVNGHVSAHKSWNSSFSTQVSRDSGFERLILSDEVLQQLVVGVSFCLSYSWTRPLALIALEHLHERATEELSPELLLQTSCLLEEQTPEDAEGS